MKQTSLDLARANETDISCASSEMNMEQHSRNNSSSQGCEETRNPTICQGTLTTMDVDTDMRETDTKISQIDRNDSEIDMSNRELHIGTREQHTCDSRSHTLHISYRVMELPHSYDDCKTKVNKEIGQHLREMGDTFMLENCQHAFLVFAWPHWIRVMSILATYETIRPILDAVFMCMLLVKLFHHTSVT